MEYTILYSYWAKFHKEQEVSFTEAFKRVQKREKILFGVVCLAVLVVLVMSVLWMLGIGVNRITLIISALALVSEFICVVLLYKYSMERCASEAKQTVNKLKAGFGTFHKWLKDMGYTKKKEIKQLSVRCEKLLEKMESEKKENINYIDKTLLLFYVPTLLAIISWILSSNVDMQDMGLYILFVFIVISAGAAAYVAIICFCKSVEDFFCPDLKKMKHMVKDLYGVLDYCFDCEHDDIELEYF